MPSPTLPPSPPLARRAWRALTSQRTGLMAGFASAALLAVGSLLMDRAPGPYAGLEGDDLRWFFQEPRLAFWWFYALAAALGLWGLSATACTLDGLVVRVRARVLRPSAYGAPLLHAAFVLALVGHLWGGLAASSQPVTLGPQPTSLGDSTYETTQVEQSTYPNGMPRRVDVTLLRRPAIPEAQLRHPSADSGEASPPPERVHLGYNEPYVRDGGAFELLLGRAGRVPFAVLAVGNREVLMRRGETVRDAGWSLTLHNVVAGRSPGAPPYASVTAVAPSGARTQTMLAMGATDSGGEPSFRRLEERPVIAATLRRNPAVPLVVLAALVAALGVLMVIAERRWRRRRAGETAASGAAPGA